MNFARTESTSLAVHFQVAIDTTISTRMNMDASRTKATTLANGR